MMLKLKDEIECGRLTLEIDKYVPFTIEIGSKPFQLLYWRGGDGKRSLIEIGLNGKSGAISSVTLTTIDHIDVKEVHDLVSTTLPETDGIAVFDIARWKPDPREYSDIFINEFDSAVSLVIGCNYCVLAFVKVDKPIRYIRNDQFRCGVSQKGELSTIEISGLTPEQIELLRLAVRPTY